MTLRTQTGTALIICLVLLTVLTLLATSTMSTATLQLTLSASDQYIARAFEAAEAGIEIAIGTIAASAPNSETTQSGTLANGDVYTATITPYGGFPPPPGYLPTFTAHHYEIRSTGQSARAATATHIQGLFTVQPPFAPAPTQGTPPLCISGFEIRPKFCARQGSPVRTYWRPRQ